MLFREIYQPIEKTRLEHILKFLLEHLPKTIVLSSGVRISKEKISYFEVKGCTALVTDTYEDIFTQAPTPDNKAYNIISKIDHKEYAALIASLPEGEHKEFLECLNLHPPFEVMLDDEKIDIQNTTLSPLQTQKYLHPKQADVDLTLLKDNAGVAYLHTHLHVESWEFLYHRIDFLKNAGVRVFYLELPKTLLDPLFHAFNRTGNRLMLEEHLSLYHQSMPEQHPYIVRLCTSAYKNGIQVLPIDSSAALRPNTQKLLDNENNHYRDQYMRVQIIKHQQVRQGEYKFAALFGMFHAKIADELRIPTIGLYPDSQTHMLKRSLNFSTTVFQMMEEKKIEKATDINFQLSSTYKPKPKSCRTPLMLKVGFFAAAAYVVVGAAVVCKVLTANK
jgi:hypothetical protein